MDMEKKETKSIEVIERAFQMFGPDQAIAFTGGKDSLTVLHMVKRVCGGRITVPVINIDTTVKFEEIYAFRDAIASEWALDLIVLTNQDAVGIEIARDKKECCYKLKVSVLNNAIEKYKFKAILTGIRWDEQAERSTEEYFSERQGPGHTRVNPVLHFTEADIWEYIKKYDLPYCGLYDEGYRSLGCKPCTFKGPDIRNERDGRSRDKEEQMKDLRLLGYF